MSATPNEPAARAVRDIAVEFVQTGAGVPDGGKPGRVSEREGTLDRRLFLTCANPECKKGGFLLRAVVDRAVKDARTEVELDLPCAGYTGPLRSERGPGAGCANRLRGAIRITYAPAKPRA